MYWAESLTRKIERALKDGSIEEPVRFNAGLSVSGLQHVGRLRGELLIGSTLRKMLEDEGHPTEQYLTLYTQDEWKGKLPQLNQFSSKEVGEKYKKWPLTHVPDPYECHEGWVEHFWEPFGSQLHKFVRDITTITTTELYSHEMEPYVKTAIEKETKIRGILNKYRKTKLPTGWSVFSPICEKCGKIGDTRETITVPETYEAEYTCNCGHSGRTSMKNGKLAWRVEWAAIWAALDVDFEAYGKDHAAPGGSRDTANEISKRIFNKAPPLGTPYEWVAYKKNGKENVMSSSDFQGFSPEEWIELAEPEILNYLYLVRKPMKQITLNLRLIPQYARRFRIAERMYFSKEEKEDQWRKKAYEFSFPGVVPKKFPFRIPYSHAALFVQTIPESKSIDEIIKRLKNQEILDAELSEWEKKLLKARLDRALTWVKRWAPLRYQITLIDTEKLSEVSPRLSKLLKDQKETLSTLLEALKDVKWNNEEIKEVMSDLIANLPSNATKRFFQGLYLAFLGRTQGPRIARYFSLLKPETVIDRLKKVLDTMK